jgi:glycyl-tRNA synthetase beta subunit
LREEPAPGKRGENLYEPSSKSKKRGKNLLSQGDFTGFLAAGAGLKAGGGWFFDKIMVMVEDEEVLA